MRRREEVIVQHAEIAPVIDLTAEISDRAACRHATRIALGMFFNRQRRDQPAFRRTHHINVRGRAVHLGGDKVNQLPYIIDSLLYSQTGLGVAGSRKGIAQAIDQRGE